MDIISFCGQIFAVAVLLSIAFSYDVDSNLEEPYQVEIFYLYCVMNSGS